MKTFSATERRTPSVQTAWGCLTTNLAMPGFGSLLGGRFATGLFQAALSVGGMGLTLVFGLRFIQWYLENWELLSQGDDPVGTLAAMWIEVRWALLGIGAFGVAWLWGLATGYSIVAEAKRRAAETVSPPAGVPPGA